MAFVYQNSRLIPADTNIEFMCQGIVGTLERTNPSRTFSTQIIREPEARTEISALHAVAMYAVRLNHTAYKTDRLYVALTAPTGSKKRKADADAAPPQIVCAVVAYDYAAPDTP